MKLFTLSRAIPRSTLTSALRLIPRMGLRHGFRPELGRAGRPWTAEEVLEYALTVGLQAIEDRPLPREVRAVDVMKLTPLPERR